MDGEGSVDVGVFLFQNKSMSDSHGSILILAKIYFCSAEKELFNALFLSLSLLNAVEMQKSCHFQYNNIEQESNSTEMKVCG